MPLLYWSLIDEAQNDKLFREFKMLLHLLARKNPQLANSVLAQLANVQKDKTLYDNCSKAHNLEDLFLASCPILTLDEVKLLISPFIDNYKKEKYFPPLIKVKSQIIKRYEGNYFIVMNGLLKIIPTTDAFWLEPEASVRDLMFHLNLKIFVTLEKKPQASL